MTKLGVGSQSVELGQIPGKEEEEKVVEVGTVGTLIVGGGYKPGSQEEVICPPPRGSIYFNVKVLLRRLRALDSLDPLMETFEPSEHRTPT